MTRWTLRTLLTAMACLCWLGGGHGVVTARLSQAGTPGPCVLNATAPFGAVLHVTANAAVHASQETPARPTKIGFISLKKISDESLKKKAFEEEIKNLLEKKKPERDAIRKEIEDLETAKALSGPEQSKKDTERIQQKKLELLRFDRELRQEVEKRQAEFEKEILRDIAEAVREVAAEKGYTWVLLDEVLMYRDDSADLTFQTLVKMNEKLVSSRPETETKPEESTSPGLSPSPHAPMTGAIEKALVDSVLKDGVRNRHTIKEIQPRKGPDSGSITMKGEGGKVRFIPQYPNDMTGGTGGVVSAPMGNKSVWRFVGEVSLSGYTFNGLDENRPLSFILLGEIGLVHLYGRGTVTFPDGHSVAIEEQKPLPDVDESGTTR